jgi:exopolysaccharide production protein ExoZ
MPDNNVKSPNRFESIALMRLLAALAVVVDHAGYYTQERLDPAAYHWMQGGKGVDLFFVISGFVMIVTSRNLQSRNDGWIRFALHRLVRIVPLYWTATTIKALSVIIVPSAALHADLTLYNYFASLFFIPAYNNGGNIHPILHPGWTLNFEMFFYALFALSLFLRWNPLAMLGSLFLTLSVSSVFVTPQWPPIAFYFDSITLNFLFGMVLATRTKDMAQRPLVGVFALAIGLMLLFSPFISDLLPAAPRCVTNGLPAALAIWGALNLEDIVRKYSHRLIDIGAEASYAMYLVPPITAPAIPVVFHHLGFSDPAICILVTFIVSVLAGVLVTKFYDLPLTNWIRRTFLAAYFSRPREVYQFAKAG